MKKFKFTKMVASGNDFIIVEKDKLSTIHYPLYAKKLCDRKFGIGADGLLILEKSKIADIKMRIFNPDGSEAEMCGNGARCVTFYLKSKIKNQKSKISIETKAGVIESEVRGFNVKIKLTNPKDIKLNIPLKINNRILKVNFINTGVPHTVIFVEGLDKIDVVNLGRRIRYHKKFMPEGTNVDFVEIKDDESIKIRTYERGVEDETFACGTGAVASAIISNIKYQISNTKGNIYKVNVYTRGGEILKVYFEREDKNLKNIWLEGRAKIIYQGVYYV
jgi:diaminopimelate epimerase